MTFNSKILESAVTADARSRALSQYLDDVSNSYAGLMNLVDEAINDESLEQWVEINDEVGVTANIPMIDNWIRDRGYRPDLLVALRDGYTQLRKLIVYSVGSTDENGESLQISLDPGNGVLVGMPMDEAFQDMQATLHAVVCMSAASAAALADNVANRLTVFRDKIASVFNSAHSTVSNTAEYYSGILNDASASTIDIVNRVTEDLQADMISSAADAETNAAPGTTDLYQYMGASPIGALDFSSAIDAVVSTVKVVAKAVATVVKGVVNLVKKAFKWIKRKVTQIISNPVDIYTISTAEGTYPSFDGWEYQFKQDTWFGMTATSFPATFDQGLMDSINAKYAGKWHVYRFFFGEVMFRFGSLYWANGYNVVDPIIKFKPYVLDPDNAATIFEESGGFIQFANGSNGAITLKDGTTPTDLAAAYQSLQDSDLYLTIKDNEDKAARGLCLAWELLYLTLRAAQLEAEDAEGVIDSITVRPFKWTGTWTNANFVSLASGWNMDPANVRFSVSNLLTNAEGSIQVTDYVLRKAVFNVVMMQGHDRHVNPTGYTFLPYESNVSGFLPGKYAIKTNAENRKAFNTFMTALVVVVAAAAIGLTASIFIRKRRAKAFWKRQEFVGQMDNKMWSGQQLTAAEKKRYKRYSKKLNASNYLTGSLNESSSSSSSVSTADSNNGLSTVIGLIAGHSQ